MDKQKTINIDGRNKKERYQILEKEAEPPFIKFNKGNLISPKFIKTDVLKKYILEFQAKYKYIDDITKGMTELTEILKLEKKIQRLKDELENLQKTTWKEIWTRELDKLDAVIRKGIETKWLFKTKPHVFKKGNARKSNITP